MGPGRGEQGAPRLEAGPSRRCKTTAPSPPPSPALPSAERRERGDLVAGQSLLPMGGEAPPFYGCYFLYGSRAQVTIYI